MGRERWIVREEVEMVEGEAETETVDEDSTLSSSSPSLFGPLRPEDSLIAQYTLRWGAASASSWCKRSRSDGGSNGIVGISNSDRGGPASFGNPLADGALIQTQIQLAVDLLRGRS